MTPDRALVAYRYSLSDIDRWPEAVVRVFANHLRRTETER